MAGLMWILESHYYVTSTAQVDNACAGVLLPPAIIPVIRELTQTDICQER